MGIIAWIVFGALSGVIANYIDPRPSQGGLISATVLGILGALVGGFLGSLMFGVGITGFDFSSFLLAIGGSLLLLFLGRAMSRRTI
jgi:uncharacterized membrane protein YeaQ/YmgE (transglycosylase-associated protein family)